MNVRPFRGYRYRGGASDLSAVVAPPYDQVSAEAQARLYTRHPHNIVRLTVPREAPGQDPYHAARVALEGWLRAGVWGPDEEPAVYPYQQTYRVGGIDLVRNGLIALGEVSDYAKRLVLPHERTHAGPKADRLRLLAATGADTGALFMLVSDPDRELARLAAPEGPPLCEARDRRGELHRLWRITDAERIARIQARLGPEPAIIADGHHRYETAVEYAERDPAGAWKLMAFFPLESALTILPTHRLVHGLEGFSLDGLARAATSWFAVEDLTDPRRFHPVPRAIGVVAGSGARVFRLHEQAFERLPWPAGTSPAWRALPVSILHEGLLRPLLGITDAMLGAQRHVDYTADAEEAVRLVAAGRYQAAFLIAPTRVEDLVAVVREGERLPPKSTHFYPKLLDGLVFHVLHPPDP
jgi:uncharacterized protein (DUF1015 family)